ncbi:right-handed parallel beta-helix repeat-containing protein [Thiorhodovibrio frisius]|uniref:Right handed beta helix domain-containing protein n=1 Tax=Thiorhodovibrio frisius TaxID=631362 RepID=H8YWR3_9GAMM|nr:right-handed parallel beta-helix repeat-containing protein [Thiorhodovibrio frisius]EIC22889.1 hypothetical protein Thi970DRAFT_00528 [Thiorhodovibrio frisius]WPL22853.1 parallel beta-helix repeat [Thiorhodovibrio frisius]
MDTTVECREEDGWNGIANALASLQPGAILRILPGIYSGSETLRIPSGVTIKAEPGSLLEWLGPGADDSNNTATGVTAGSSAVLVEDAEDVTLIGLHLRALEPSSPPADGAETAKGALVHGRATRRLRIDACEVENGGGLFHGIHLKGSDHASVISCRVADCCNGIFAESFSELQICNTSSVSNHSHGIELVQPINLQVLALASDATLIANRCHHNHNAGIALFHSKAHLAGNVCSNNQHGIQVSPHLYLFSKGTLIANRCHDNHEAGIILFSSEAHLEGNVCWDNRLHGIELKRDERTPNTPSKGPLTANRCHDNHESGIVLASSEAHLEGNVCWENRIHGITLHRDSKSPDAPSKGTLTANWCWRNTRSGIRYLASDGHVDKNVCWKNGENDPARQGQRIKPRPAGITRDIPAGDLTVGKHFTVPPMPPEDLRAWLIDKRPDKDLVNDLLDEDIEPAEELADFLTDGASLSFERFWGMPQGAHRRSLPLTHQRSQPTLSADAATADSNDTNKFAMRVYEVMPVVSDDNSDTIEIVRRTLDGEPIAEDRIGSTGPLTESANSTDTTWLPPLSRLFVSFVKNWLDTSIMTPKKQAPTWALGFFSADTKELDELLDTLGDKGNRERWTKKIMQDWASELATQDEAKIPAPRLQFGAPLVIDLAGYAESIQPPSYPEQKDTEQKASEKKESEKTEAEKNAEALWQKIEDTLLPSVPDDTRGFSLKGMQAWAKKQPFLAVERLREVTFFPASESFWFFLILFATPLVMIVGFAWQQEINVPHPYELPVLAWEHLQTLSLGLRWFFYISTGLVMYQAFMWALNSLLPRGLHLRWPVLSKYVETWWSQRAVMKAFVDDIKGFLYARLGNPEPSARRRWLAHRFNRSLWRRNTLGIVVFKNLEWLPTYEGDGIHQPADWLRALAELKNPDQGLLIITHTTGISNLPSTFLNIWYPSTNTLGANPEGNGYGLLDRTLLLHDLASARIVPRTSLEEVTRSKRMEPKQKEEQETRALRDLSNALGLPSPERQDDHDEEMNAMKLNDQEEFKFKPVHLLPATVLGSVPGGQIEFHFRLHKCKDLTRYNQCTPDDVAQNNGFTDEMCALVMALGGDNQKPNEWSDQCDDLRTALKDYAVKGQGILFIRFKENGTACRRLIGRPALRTKIADALQRLDGFPLSQLRRYIAAGEVWHLRKAIKTIKTAPRNENAHDSSSFASRIPLYLQAAHWLLGERLALTLRGGGGDDTKTTVNHSTEGSGHDNASDLSDPAIAGMTWQELHEVLITDFIKHDFSAVLAHAGRIYCTFLAGVSAWDEAMEKSGAPATNTEVPNFKQLLDEFDEALKLEGNSTETGEQNESIRTRFYTEAREFAATMSRIDTENAQTLFSKRLRQEWSMLPDSFARVLKEHAFNQPGERLIGELVQAKDADDLLDRVQGWGLRPASVVAALAWIALEYRRDPKMGAKPPKPEDVLPVAYFANRMRELLSPDIIPETLPSLLPPRHFEPEQGQLIENLLINETDFPDRLVGQLKAGAAAHKDLSHRIEQLPRIDLDGVVFGSRSAVNQVIKDLYELKLSTAPSSSAPTKHEMAVGQT